MFNSYRTLCTWLRQELEPYTACVLPYREVSSFHRVRIGEFHCIQRCPHFRVLE